MTKREALISGWLSVYGIMPTPLISDTLELIRRETWISVNDRLPDDEDGLLNKLVIDTEGQIRICGSVSTWKRRDGTKVFMADSPLTDALLRGVKNIDDIWEITHITHWMPLPEPPEEV